MALSRKRGGRCSREEEPADPSKLRVLVIEDDDYQKIGLAWVLESAGRSAGLTVTVKHVETGAAALEQCRDESFDLVMMDYILLSDDGTPSRAASSHLPAIRSQLGASATIVMLSTSEQEVQLARCLDLGADAYRLKPLVMDAAKELLKFSREKRDFLQKRRRISTEREEDDESAAPSVADGMPLGTSAWSPAVARRARRPGISDRREPLESLSRRFTMLSADGSVFAHGRRSPVHLGMWSEGANALGTGASACAAAHGGPLTMVAIKVCHKAHLRGPPPPPHPHVNGVLQQLVEGERAFVVRVLCDGGELFDKLRFGPPLREEEALEWFVQIATAVAHCHAHSAVHGQLRAENCLLRLGLCQLVGFSTYRKQGTGTTPNSSQAQQQQYFNTMMGGSGGGGGGAAGGGGHTSDVLGDIFSTPSTLEMLYSSDESTASTTSGGGGPHDVLIELRPNDPLDAPELRFRRSAAAHELFACDVWALGVLLVALLTGEPGTRLPRNGSIGSIGAGSSNDSVDFMSPVAASPLSSRAGNGGGRLPKNASWASELSLGLHGMCTTVDEDATSSPPRQRQRQATNGNGGGGGSSTNHVGSQTLSASTQAAIGCGTLSPIRSGVTFATLAHNSKSSPIGSPMHGSPQQASSSGGMRRARSVHSSMELAGEGASSRAELLVDLMLQQKPEKRPTAREIVAQLARMGFACDEDSQHGSGIQVS